MQYAEKSVAKKRQENDSSRTARKPDNFGACQDAVQRTLTLMVQIATSTFREKD
jgi:hypothetical protein